jgi:SAM-dependent methyltransferase
VTAPTAEFWSPRKVAWYERALARGNYAATVLGVLAPVLAECETALDVGAGAGALTLPLAERLRHVTAIEPSPAMAAALRTAVARRELPNVDVVQTAWGEAPVGMYDLVLCAHVGPLLTPRAAFLRDVSAHARRWVALVRDPGQSRDKFWFTELYPLLLGRPYERRGEDRDLGEGLADLPSPPIIETVHYRSDQPFTDLEDACDFFQEYLGVNGRAPRAVLRDFLAARLVRDGTGWLAPYTKQAAVIYWRTAPA